MTAELDLRGILAPDRALAQRDRAADSRPARAPPVVSGPLRDVLFGGLSAVRFEDGELAYLALTSKPELYVRDRLAWALSKAGHDVAREWRRLDLVILRDGLPEAVVQLKVMYAGEAYLERHMRLYRPSIARDIESARRLAPDAEAFVLVVVTSVLDPVPRRLDGLVKYAATLRRPGRSVRDASCTQGVASPPSVPSPPPASRTPEPSACESPSRDGCAGRSTPPGRYTELRGLLRPAKWVRTRARPFRAHGAPDRPPPPSALRH
jgi:hypothetical protein